MIAFAACGVVVLLVTLVLRHLRVEALRAAEQRPGFSLPQPPPPPLVPRKW